MIEKIVNILICDENADDANQLYSFLRGDGNNIFIANSHQDALEIINQKEITIFLCSFSINFDENTSLIQYFSSKKKNNIEFIVGIGNNTHTNEDIAKIINSGAIDFIQKPFYEKLIIAKIRVLKKLYFKSKRVSNLLENILPESTLNEFNTFGKSTPKKFNNCTVLFTDFVSFSSKVPDIKPKDLIEKLDYFFSKFDEIILKYNLEKIKTIGDAYMAVGGVNGFKNHVQIRTALAAIEIKNFIQNDITTKKALGKDYWEIRIGIHTGSLIAGVIGKHKFSFDVWGDTVNIAARCEQNSLPNQITVTKEFIKKIDHYFVTEKRGQIEIKNRGKKELFFLNSIKKEFSLYEKGVTANVELRNLVGLPKADFDGLRNFILYKLKAELDDNLFYHSYKHTLNVETSVIKYAKLEGVNKDDLFILRTAALFHDSGYLISYTDNEKIGAQIFKNHAPTFGYTDNDIKKVEKIILSTNNHIKPKNILEKIMCDADHDYLGRRDYHIIAYKLYKELSIFEKEYSEKEWIKMQIYYLENKHKYFTTSAFNLRQLGKEKRIKELYHLLSNI